MGNTGEPGNDPPSRSWKARRIAAVGLALVALLIGWWERPRGAARLSFPPPVRPARSRTPFEAALGRARAFRVRAIEAANEQRYPLLEGSAPEVTRDADTESWRRQLTARDATGDVARALAAAREAAALARTPAEEYRARVWLALIAFDAGRHEEELRQARRLVELDPGNEMSFTSLRRAARCNRQWALVREAEAGLVRLGSPYAGRGREMAPTP